MTDEELGFIEAGVRDGCAFTAATVEALLARLRAAEAARDEWARQCNMASEAQANALAHAAKERDHVGRKVAALYDERDASRARAEQAERELEEARAALIRSQEDYHAAVEGLETYEERIEAAVREADRLVAENAALRAVAEAAREALDGWDSRRFVLYCTEKLRAALAALPKESP